MAQFRIPRASNFGLKRAKARLASARARVVAAVTAQYGHHLDLCFADPGEQHIRIGGVNERAGWHMQVCKRPELPAIGALGRGFLARTSRAACKWTRLRQIGHRD